VLDEIAADEEINGKQRADDLSIHTHGQPCFPSDRQLLHSTDSIERLQF